jgi:hypothetical protein
MTADSNVKVTIAFNDSELDSEELETQAQNLLTQMRDLDGIETVDRVLDPNPPEGNKRYKAVEGTLVGFIAVETSKEMVKKLLGFLGNHIGNKSIELEVEANGKRLKVKASSQAELETAIEAAQKFVEA